MRVLSGWKEYLNQNKIQHPGRVLRCIGIQRTDKFIQRLQAAGF
jgi:hypothetical protein